MGDVGLFITEKMTELAENKRFKKSAASKLFKSTFEIVNNSIGEDAFKRFNVKKGRHEGGFLLSLYETVALGIAYNLANDSLCEENEIHERAQSLWSNTEFKSSATSGTRAGQRLPRLIPLGRRLFSKK